MKKYDVLVIEPEKNERCEQETSYTYGGHRCPCCSGTGWVYGQRDERVNCPACKGAKYLKAVITVKWAADV